MDYFPIFLDLKQTRALVVGGGAVAARKAKSLHDAGARVLVIAETLCQELQTRLGQDEVEYVSGEFAPEMLQDCSIAVAATSDRAVNRKVARLCRKRGIPVNVVDDREVGGCLGPAVVGRSRPAC